MCHFEWKYRKWGNKGEIVANLACEMKWGWNSAQEGGSDTYGEKWKEGKASMEVKLSSRVYPKWGKRGENHEAQHLASKFGSEEDRFQNSKVSHSNWTQNSDWETT